MSLISSFMVAIRLKEPIEAINRGYSRSAIVMGAISPREGMRCRFKNMNLKRRTKTQACSKSMQRLASTIGPDCYFHGFFLSVFRSFEGFFSVAMSPKA
jgi:hypothetical protein